MGLENITDFIADLLHQLHKALDLVGVVGIIVYDQIPAVIAMDIEPPFNAREIREYCCYGLAAYAEFRKECDACKARCIGCTPRQREFKLLPIDPKISSERMIGDVPCLIFRVHVNRKKTCVPDVAGCQIFVISASKHKSLRYYLKVSQTCGQSAQWNGGPDRGSK